MAFIIRLIAGAGIVVLSTLAARAMPQYAWTCGWLGACVYYLVMPTKHWDGAK